MGINIDKNIVVLNCLIVYSLVGLCRLECTRYKNLSCTRGKTPVINHIVIWLIMSTFQTWAQRGYSDVTSPFLSYEGAGTPRLHLWLVAFNFTQTPALPRCLSNNINTSLWSKEKPFRWNLTHHCHLWFVLACFITNYGNICAWANCHP